MLQKILKKNSHLFAVDILRGVAIIMVVIYHVIGPVYGWYLPWSGWVRDFSNPPSSGFMAIYPISFGWAGVSLFFVLSGFCIHLSFLRSPEFSIWRFYWQRFWRIAPAYFVSLISFFYLLGLTLDSHSGANQFIAHILFLHNLNGGSVFFGINASFWSLAVEVQLYLLFPLLVMGLRRYGINRCLLIAFLIGLLWRIVAACFLGLPEHLITQAYTFPLVTWFDWILGVYVADSYYNSRAGFSRRGLWLGFSLLIFVLSTIYKPLTLVSFTLASVISAITLDWLISLRIPRVELFRCIAFIGTLSYSIYLWHQPLLSIMPTYLNKHMGWGFMSFVVVIFILSLALFSYKILEQGGVKMGAWLLQFFQKTRGVE